MTKVSIIVPTYNHAHYLPSAVESALRQSFKDFEIIIVDDGSTDNTRQVASQWIDSRIQYVYQANKGLSGARNTGIHGARGEYLAFLDADDILQENKLETQVNWLTKHPDAGLVAGGWNLIDDNGHLLETYHPGPLFPDMSVKGWLYDCHVCPASILVRKDWVEQVQGFDETLRQVEDWDLWLRLAYAGCQMGWVDEIVCSYRLSTGQMTRNAAVQMLSSIEMMDKFYNQADLPIPLLEIKPAVYTRLYLIGAGREYGVGQWQDAQESLVRAVEYFPRLKDEWDAEHVQMLLGWEDSVYNRSVNRISSIDFRENLFSHLPEIAQALKLQRRRLMAEAGLKTFYWAYELREWPLVRKSARIIALNNLKLFFKRGFWSILMKSLFSSTQS